MEMMWTIDEDEAITQGWPVTEHRDLIAEELGRSRVDCHRRYVEMVRTVLGMIEEYGEE